MIVVAATTYLAVLELEAGTRDSARLAAEHAVRIASSLGLTDYPGVGAAYAVRARTVHDEGLALDDARHAITLVRRASTNVTRAYVLAAAADTLLDHADAEGQLLLSEAHALLGRCPDPGVVGACVARVRSRHGLVGDRPLRKTELVEHLTDRELAVVRYLPTPLSQRDIAAELYVSLNTVKTYCQAAYRKLGVTDRKSAVQAARDQQLL